jgi:TP901 family phage tail tape measure protein
MDRELKIRMMLEASDKVTRPLRDIAAGSRAATGALKETRDRLKELERAQGDITSFRKLKNEIRGSETEMQAAQARVAALARQMGEASSPTRQLTREFEKAKREAAGLKTENERQSVALQQVRDRLRAAGVGTADLVTHERDLRSAIERTNRELTEQTDRLGRADARTRRFAEARERFGRVQGMATGLAAGGAAGIATGMTLARPLAGSVKEAQDYESVMTDIAQKASLSRVQAAAMGKELLLAARAANQMPTDMQTGVDTLMGFGKGALDAAAMMKPIGKAATAYKAEIGDLSAAAFAANDNLKVPVAQTARVIDIMAEAGKAGAFEVKDMAGAFPALTAGYQALGQTGVGAVADLAAALQIARKGAGDSATAANNVSNIIQKISAPATIKAFKKMGIELPAALKKAYAEGKTPLEAIAELTRKATGGDLGKIGFLFEDSQVQQGLRPLIQNMEEYRKIRAQAAGASGTTDRDFAERMKDSAEQSKRLKIQGTALAISMGTILLPTVNAIAQKIGVFADRLANLSQRHPLLTKVVVLSAAALTGLFLVLGAGAIVLAAFMGPIAIINAGLVAMGVAGGVASIGLLPIIGTVLAVVAAIALIAGAVYLIYVNWGSITGWFSGLWQGLKNIVSGALAWFGTLPSRFAEFGRNMIMGLIGGITGKMGTLKSAVVGAANSAANWFKSKLGIKSPSRVFAGFGGFMMQGLANGIDRDAGRPVRRINALSRAVTAAMAVTSVSPALAVPTSTGASFAAKARSVKIIDTRDQPATSRGAQGSASQTGGGDQGSSYAAPVYHVTVNAAPGMDEDALARAVARELDRRERDAHVRRRSSYRDDADGADV